MTLLPTFHRAAILLAVAALIAGCGRKIDPRAQEGYDLVVAGKIDEAIAFTNAILADEPDNAYLRTVLGLALYRTGDAEGSIEQYRRALESDPGYAEAHFNLGNALGRLGRDEEAESEYAQAVRLQKDFVLARYNLGKLYEKSDRLDQAMAEYRRCIDIDPQFVFAYMDLGKHYYASGDHDRAVENLSRTLELAPNIKEVRVQLGNAYMQSGVENALELAEAEFRAAVGIDPEYAQAVYSLGLVLALQERQEEAIEWFEKVLTMQSEDTSMIRQVHEYFREVGHTPSSPSGAEEPSAG